MHSPRSCLKEALWIIITFCIVYLTLCHMFMQRGSISKRMFRGVRNVENQSHAAGNTLHTRIIENIGDDGVSQNHNSSHIDRHLKQGSECNSTYDELAHSQDDSGKRGKRAHISTWCCPSCLRGGREEYRRSFKIGGYVFKPNDTSYINPHVITTALVHNFSSFIEAEVQKRTLDPFHDASYCAISPALENSHEGYLMAFLVHRCPHVVHKRGVLGSSNNLVFVQKYDKELRSQGYGYFLGFSYHRIDKFGGGPHDPRAFTINGTVYLLFRASVYANRAARLSKQKPILWDLTENLPKIAILRNNRLGARLQKLLRDKNWMPLVDNNQLYFVQSLDPVLVLSCTLDAVCTYIENVDSVNNTLNQSTHLMGGSQFQLWRYPYYIAAVQSRYSNNLGNDIYAAHLAIISLPHFRLVFFSEALQLNESLYKSTPSHHAFNSTWEIFFPVSLLLESQDSVLVGGHINYAISILVRVRGIQKIMEDIIKTDSAANPLALKPQPTVVQYFFQSSLAQNTTTKRSKK